jgi:tripeptidyl-peptidase I
LLFEKTRGKKIITFNMTLSRRISGCCVAIITLACIVLVSTHTTTYAEASVESVMRPAYVQLRNDWKKALPVSGEQRLRIGAALKLQNVDELEHTLLQVSDPKSARYGQHLSQEELIKLVAPDNTVVEAMRQWWTAGLDESEYTFTVSATRDFVQMETSVAHWSKLLGVDFHVFVHQERLKYASMTGRSVESALLVRTEDSIRVPAELDNHIDIFTRLHDFPPLPNHMRLAISKVQGEFPGSNTTPPVLLARYNISQGAPVDSESNSLAVAEFEQAYFYQSDLNEYQKKYGLNVRNVTIHGPNKPQQGYLGECSLDTQVGSIINASVWDFSQDQFDLITWAQFVLSTPNAPLVLSISWGSDESGFPADQRTRTSQEFMKMGSMGYTVVAAAGDDATGHTGTFSCGTFSPTFPATAPYVTAVGGTYYTTASGPETVWSLGGGGFSSAFSRPAYQEAACSGYLNSNVTLPGSQYYNASGRGIPDVTALATNYQIYSTGYLGSLSGTSAATPVWATLFARLNAARSKPLGFANPWLYSLKGGVGQDITLGGNKNPSCPAGFLATSGWDASSGLGSPDLNKLLAGMVL